MNFLTLGSARDTSCAGPRRSGKDLCAWYACIRIMLEKPTQVYFVYPTYSQGKKILFEGLDNNGFPLIDYLPRELIASKNSQEMSIKLINGSLFKIVGSDEPNRLVGTNASFMVFSEYALQNPEAWQYLRQVVAANQGTAIFISTPRGRNHFYDLFEYAKTQPDEWFVSKLTVDDTKHISAEDLEKERRECSEDLIQQEWYTSFSLGVEGSYYSKYLNAIRVNNQITNVPWQPYQPVHCSVDIGYRDSTAIVWFQKIGDTSFNILDCYQNTKHGLDHYAKVILDKPYTYGKMIFPHDLAVTEYGSGLTRLEQARALGLNPTIAPKLSIEDGIEAVRALIPRCYFDERKCQPLLKALESYRQLYDAKKQVYLGTPNHDWACFVGETELLTRNGMRPIIDIQKDDEILTLYGWKKCNKAKLMKKNAQLVEVTFKDGTKVKCTPEHMFLTVSGWKSAKDLIQNTVIQSYAMNSRSTLMAKYSENMLEKDIMREDQIHYIERFGDWPLVKFLKDVIFTIKIAIQRIIIYPILNACQKKNILNCQNQTQRSVAKHAMQPLNGTDRLKVDCGTSSMQYVQKGGQNGQENQENAYIAQKNLIVSLEKMAHSKSSVTPIAKHLIIESVNYLNERADVYCINVPEVSHFSLSNGAIVHNSHYADSFRYLAVSQKLLSDTLSASDLDNLYKQSRLGSESVVPKPFQQPNHYGNW